jgi:hypothetical protein
MCSTMLCVEVINLNPLSPLGYERKHEALQGMGRRDEAVRTFNDMRSILERSADPQTRCESMFCI